MGYIHVLKKIQNSFNLTELFPDYILNTEQAKLSIYLKLTGPFISEQYEKKLNDSVKANMTAMRIWLEKWHLKKDRNDYSSSDDIVHKLVS